MPDEQDKYIVAIKYEVEKLFGKLTKVTFMSEKETYILRRLFGTAGEVTRAKELEKELGLANVSAIKRNYFTRFKKKLSIIEVLYRKDYFYGLLFFMRLDYNYYYMHKWIIDEPVYSIDEIGNMTSDEYKNYYKKVMETCFLSTEDLLVLDPLELRVLKEYFGLGYVKYNISEIARRLDVHPAKVRLTIDKALVKLKDVLNDINKSKEKQISL